MGISNAKNNFSQKFLQMPFAVIFHFIHKHSQALLMNSEGVNEPAYEMYFSRPVREIKVLY